MPNRYRQTVNSSQTHFTNAPMGEIEFSRMDSNPVCITDFNASEIVPVYYAEVLPHDTFDISVNFDIRQSTIAVPTMGNMIVDYYAYFVPNRVVNQSWKNVQGENTSGSWIAPEVSLAPLMTGNEVASDGETRLTEVQVPVCSVADYYGFPTQQPLPITLLQQCHDLKFRGYLEIYNNYFRDQNYQPPIPYSKLNIYNGFMLQEGSSNPIDGSSFGYPDVSIDADSADGSFYSGAVTKALFGEGASVDSSSLICSRYTTFSALSKPLKANKLHDYFTSVLPSPQKGRQVVIGLLDNVPLDTGDTYNFSSGNQLKLRTQTSMGNLNADYSKLSFTSQGGSRDAIITASELSTSQAISGLPVVFNGANLYADLSGVAISVDDLRMSAAVQQLYEILGRSGSRYVEFVNSFFGLEVENPFDDIPTQLGHIRRELNLYQTAQTSASSADGSGSPQGNLAAFGYTSNGGHLFTKTFVEHGYIHIFAVVRHKNLYSSYFARDNFRRNMLDFYTYPLANISEQPVYTREINPFVEDQDSIFGYQEAWAEYRMEPDRVTGHMRTGLGSEGLDFWNYADPFDPSLEIADADFIASNSNEVLARTTALAETLAPQFKAQMTFKITKQRPMPTYSVAGLDII